MTDALHVVVVGDEPGFGGTVAHHLERESDRFEVSTERQVSAALERVRDGSVACVVSDYEMPAMDGLEFLDAVRRIDADLPFVLFTGNGSESLASKALSHGVTDYVQKTGSPEQFKVLANRIEAAVESHRARRTLERERERYRTFLEQSTDLIAVVDGSGRFEFVSQAWQRIMGYEPEELVGENAFELMHPADTVDVWEEFRAAVSNPDETRTAEFRFSDADGTWHWLEAVGNNQFSNPLIEGFIVNVRDITERKEREHELREQNDRLERFATVVSHDLRNPMNVLSGHLELARETGDARHFEAARDALTRMNEMVDDVLELAREGQVLDDTEPIALGPLVDQCRESVDSDSLTLSVGTNVTVHGDRARLKRVFENLLRNADEHAGPDVTVTVGRLDDQSGFYVEDDGPGIPPAEQDDVLESGYTTTEDGTGLGLAIVESIVEAHGWSISVTDGADGGTRFEVTDVELPPVSAQ